MPPTSLWAGARAGPVGQGLSLTPRTCGPRRKHRRARKARRHHTHTRVTASGQKGLKGLPLWVHGPELSQGDRVTAEAAGENEKGYLMVSGLGSKTTAY